MIDREKIIAALENCSDPAGKCRDCPYEECEKFEKSISEYPDELIRKAVELLKEKVSGEWIYCEDDCGQDGYRCSGCGFFEPWYYNYTNHDFIKKYQFCPSCGAVMKERTK